MSTNRLAGIVILIFVFIMGCSGGYGNLRTQTDHQEKMTLAELRENWEDYTIYYSYRWASKPSAIMFDLKNDDKKLVGDNWHVIEDQKALSETIHIIQLQYDHCHVDMIEGPDNQFFGYIYYPHWLNLPVNVVDERTLYVSTLPPHKSAP